MASAMALCRQANVGVLAAGSGPSFFAPVGVADLPPSLLRDLEHDWGVNAVACRTLTREAATALREV
jgi:hypothetical protein